MKMTALESQKEGERTAREKERTSLRVGEAQDAHAGKGKREGTCDKPSETGASGRPVLAVTADDARSMQTTTHDDIATMPPLLWPDDARAPASDGTGALPSHVGILDEQRDAGDPATDGAGGAGPDGPDETEGIDDELPYGGDLNAAVEARDREAIKVIMASKRQGGGEA